MVHCIAEVAAFFFDNLEEHFSAAFRLLASCYSLLDTVVYIVFFNLLYKSQRTMPW